MWYTLWNQRTILEATNIQGRSGDTYGDVRNVDHETLRQDQIYDFYEAGQVPDGFKSIGDNIVIDDTAGTATRTWILTELTAEEKKVKANTLIQSQIKSLEEQSGVVRVVRENLLSIKTPEEIENDIGLKKLRDLNTEIVSLRSQLLT